MTNCKFHRLLKVIREDSFANTKTNQPVAVQPSGRAFEGVPTSRSVLQINIEDVQKSEQHCTDARSISILQKVYFSEVDTIWEVSAIRLDDSTSRPDDVLYLQTVRTT